MSNDQSTDSIFTKIIKGEVPSHKVYEDERSFAFLDINPIQPGHVLVVPKSQVAYAWDLDDADYHAIMATARTIALALRKAFPDKQYVAMHIEGLDVAHTHLKVFPFNTDEEFRSKPDHKQPTDHTALAQIAERIIQTLNT